MSHAEIFFGVIALLMTIGGGVVAMRLKPLEDKDTANEKAIEAEAKAREKALDDQAELYDRRIDALHSDKKELEKRMSELEKTALTRSELDAVRHEMTTAVERMGDRVMKHFDETATRLEKRVERVEAQT